MHGTGPLTERHDRRRVGNGGPPSPIPTSSWRLRRHSSRPVRGRSPRCDAGSPPSATRPRWSRSPWHGSSSSAISMTSDTRRPGSRPATGRVRVEARRCVGELRLKGIEPAVIEGALAERDGPPGRGGRTDQHPARLVGRPGGRRPAAASAAAPPSRASPTPASVARRRMRCSPATASTPTCVPAPSARHWRDGRRRCLAPGAIGLQATPIRTRLVGQGNDDTSIPSPTTGSLGARSGMASHPRLARRPCPDGTSGPRAPARHV